MKSRWQWAVLSALIAINSSCASKDSDDPGNEVAARAPPQSKFRNPSDIADPDTTGTPPEVAEANLAAVLQGGTEELPDDKLAERLEVSLKLLEQAVDSLPRDTFDPKAIVDRLGNDPLRLFEWVRDQTTLVPYRGVLRGPVGVLNDRRGNSLDRSLLLAEMLRLAGHEVRLARATLPERQVRELLKRSTEVHRPLSQPVAALAEPTEDFARSYARQVGGDAEQIRRSFARVRETADTTWREAARRASVQSATLIEVLGPALPSSDTKLLERHLDGFSDHWWVQRRVEDDWVDLDLDGSSAGSGKALVAAASVMTPDEIGDDLRHRVRISVVVERAVDGRLEESTVLDQTLRVTDVGGTRIALGHSPMAIPSSADPFQEQDPSVWLNKYVYDQDAWTPFLAVGANQAVQSSFTLSGEVLPPGATGPGPRNGPGGITDAFGGFGDFGEESTAPPVSGRLTAEFLDYELLVPGQAPRKERRALFDWVGPSVRAARDPRKIASLPPRPLEAMLDIASETDILIAGAQPSAELVAHLVGQSYLTIGRAAVQLLRNQSQIGGKLDDAAKSSPPPSPVLLSLAFSRGQLSRHADKVRIVEPTVLSVHSGLTYDPETSYRLWAGLDIVTNGIDVDPSSAADSAHIRLEQGVLDTNVESVLAGGGNAKASVVDLMSATGGDARSWESLSDPARLGAASDWPADPRSRVAADVSRGFMAVIPKDIAAPNAVWWRVNPATGLTLGIGDRGWGQDANETLLADLRVAIKMITLTGCALYQSTFRKGRWYKAVFCVAGGGFATAGVLKLGPVGGALFSTIADAISAIAMLEAVYSN